MGEGTGGGACPGGDSGGGGGGGVRELSGDFWGEGFLGSLRPEPTFWILASGDLLLREKTNSNI